MKIYPLLAIVCLILCAVSFYAGMRYGKFNGQIEIAAANTGPLMNLLLFAAGKNKELVEMNRYQLYSNLGIFEALRTSRMVSPENKQLVEQRILVAKDYWQAAGGTILQTNEEMKEHRKWIEDRHSSTGITPGLIINGVEVSPFHFEQQDDEARRLFSKYSDQKSYLHDFIVGMVQEAKNRPNKAPEPTPTSVTSPAAQEPRQP